MGSKTQTQFGLLEMVREKGFQAMKWKQEDKQDSHGWGEENLGWCCTNALTSSPTQWLPGHWRLLMVRIPHPSWRPPVLTTRVHFLPLGLLSVSVFTHHFVSLATVVLSLGCSQVLIILPMISKADTCLNFHTSKKWLFRNRLTDIENKLTVIGEKMQWWGGINQVFNPAHETTSY